MNRTPHTKGVKKTYQHFGFLEHGEAITTMVHVTLDADLVQLVGMNVFVADLDQLQIYPMSRLLVRIEGKTHSGNLQSSWLILR